MVINLTLKKLPEAANLLGRWLSQYGGIQDSTMGMAAAEKLLLQYGSGKYEVREKGKLYKGQQLIVHRDDVKDFVMGKEMKIEKKDVKEVKEEKKDVKEEKKEEVAVPKKGVVKDRRRARKLSNPWTK